MYIFEKLQQIHNQSHKIQNIWWPFMNLGSLEKSIQIICILRANICITFLFLSTKHSYQNPFKTFLTYLTNTKHMFYCVLVYIYVKIHTKNLCLHLFHFKFANSFIIIFINISNATNNTFIPASDTQTSFTKTYVCHTNGYYII